MREPYTGDDPVEMYLDLLKIALTRYRLEEHSDLEPFDLRKYEWSTRARLLKRVNSALASQGLQVARIVRRTPEQREQGLDWPLNAETMVGLKRLDQLHKALDVIREEAIPGAVMETGVWRGGASIFMAGYMRAHRLQRDIYAADSFEGLPAPDPAYPADAGDEHHRFPFLSVDLTTVENNFAKYGLLTERVIFVKGFFEDSLPTVEVEQLALLRLDGDMYSSTIQVLENMYSRVSPGGFVIIDDYGLQGARRAVHDFFSGREQQPSVKQIDSQSVYWRV